MPASVLIFAVEGHVITGASLSATATVKLHDCVPHSFAAFV